MSGPKKTVRFAAEIRSIGEDEQRAHRDIDEKSKVALIKMARSHVDRYLTDAQPFTEHLGLQTVGVAIEAYIEHKRNTTQVVYDLSSDEETPVVDQNDNSWIKKGSATKLKRSRITRNLSLKSSLGPVDKTVEELTSSPIDRNPSPSPMQQNPPPPKKSRRAPKQQTRKVQADADENEVSSSPPSQGTQESTTSGRKVKRPDRYQP